jgi:PKD repeat protein
MKPFTRIMLCFMLLYSITARNQNAPVTTAGTVVSQGPTVVVPVNVTNFIDIGAISLTLDYDFSIVQVTGVTPNTNLPGFSSNWTAVPGRLIMGWYGTSGVTLPDNEVLVDITFTGLVAGETNLSWMDDGGSCEYAKYNNGANTVLNDTPAADYYKNGHIAWGTSGPKTIAPFYCSQAGQDICIPVKVNQFINIGAISLTLDYDPSVLEFQSINTTTIPGTWSFDGQAVVPGRLIVGGMGPGIPYLPDGSVLFYTCFHYNGGTSLLTWYDEDLISCEYADATTLTPLADRPMEDYYINGWVGSSSMTADFIADNLTPLKLTTVSFTDLSTGSPTAWDWTFDKPVIYMNGTTSHSQNPQVQYTESCLYTVTLVVHNETEYCPDTAIKVGYIRVGAHGLWTGLISSDWYISENWDDCLVPEATTDVLIPAAAPNWPVHAGNLGIDEQCRDITLDGAATKLTISGNLSIPLLAAGVVVNRGTIILKGNLENGNPSATDLGPGTVEFSGTVPQAITGLNSFGNLTLDNSAGLSLNADQRVNGTLTLTNGVLTIGSRNLILGPSALTSGTFSSSAMVAADGTGQFRKEFSAPGTFLFPVGDITVDPDYSPVTLDFTSGTFGSNNYAGVNLVNEKYPSPDIADNYTGRYWNLYQNNFSNFSCNATFKYTVSDINGDESILFCLKVDPMPWVGYDAANIVTHELTANGLSSFSTFTGVGIHKAYMKVFLEGLYDGGGLMRKAQDEYGDHFSGNIADQVTVDLHDAGNYSNILYSSGLVDLTTSGDVIVSAVPAVYSGSYYVTIMHRNSLETTSSLPLSFAGGIITYNFSTAESQAYGDNMKNIGGVYVLYGGEIFHDGIIDGDDMDYIDNASAPPVTYGYVIEDANGDGIVDADDMNIIDNNSTAIVMSILP